MAVSSLVRPTPVSGGARSADTKDPSVNKNADKGRTERAADAKGSKHAPRTNDMTSNAGPSVPIFNRNQPAICI
jgi:hypothetical protein